MDSSVPYRLVIESDENRGMIYPLRERSVTIGRGPQSHIQIIDTRMSRAHARLEFDGGGWLLRDLKSKNGVTVNSLPVPGSVRLNPGDQLQVGNTLFTFEADVVGSEAGMETLGGGVRLVDDDETLLNTSHILEISDDDNLGDITGRHRAHDGSEERLRSIYQIGKLIQSSLNLDELLNKVMETICQALQPYQACILLFDKKRNALVPRVTHRPDGDTENIVISGSVIHQAIDDRVAVVMRDGDVDHRFSGSESIVLNRIHSAICAPLISKGDVLGALYLDLRSSTRSYDESDLEWVAGIAGQAAMAIAVSLLHGEMVQRQRQEQELEFARSIQMNLLPKKMPEIPGFEFGGVSRPARMVGGDYFDIIELRDGNYAMLIADVSGKGVPSALLLASFRSAVRIEAQTMTRETLIPIVSRLNEMIYNDSTSNMFITMAIALFEPPERRLTYCNAGHFYPIVRMPDGALVTLEKGGSLLGVMPGMTFESDSIILSEGAMVVFFTDGVLDAVNSENKPFGPELLTEFIQKNHNLPAQTFCDELERSVEAFQGEAEQFDDMTVMTMKATGDDLD